MRTSFKLLVALTLLIATPGYGAQVRVTGTFTDLRYIQESGDLLGLELLIVPAQGDSGGYVAFVQLAEGAGPYSALVPVKVSGDRVSFSMPAHGAYAGLSFSGLLGADKLTGTW